MMSSSNTSTTPYRDEEQAQEAGANNIDEYNKDSTFDQHYHKQHYCLVNPKYAPTCVLTAMLVTLVVTLSVVLPKDYEETRGHHYFPPEDPQVAPWVYSPSNALYIDPVQVAQEPTLTLNRDGSVLAVSHEDGVHVYRSNDQDDEWTLMGAPVVHANSTASHVVSLSGDGRTLAIGAFLETQSIVETGFTATGRVQVLSFVETQDQLDDNAWQQVGQDLWAEGGGDQFGIAVSLSDNGRTVAVGGHLSSDQQQRAGHVRVFGLGRTISSSDQDLWMQIGTDLDGVAQGDEFGSTVAISQDGRTVAVGSRYSDNYQTGQEDVGSVRAFRYDSVARVWQQLGGVVVQGDSAEEQFGTEVCMSGQGDTIAVGNADNELVVSRYDHDTEDWVLAGRAFSMHGYRIVSCQLSTDGDVMAVLKEPVVKEQDWNSERIATVFHLDETTGWSVVMPERVGHTIALSGTGHTMAVAATDVVTGGHTIDFLTSV